MVEDMQLLGIEIDSVLGVVNEGVVRPAIPKPGHDVVELARPAIAGVVLPMLVPPEIPRFRRIAGGDEIPSRAPAADVVERGEFARDVIGLVIGRRRRGDEADALRHHRQRGQQGQRIERRDRRATLQRRHRHVQDRQMIGHEEGVELSLLQLLRKPHQVLQVEIGVRICARIEPPGGMDSDGTHESAEFQLPCVAHEELSFLLGAMAPCVWIPGLVSSVARVAEKPPIARSRGCGSALRVRI